MRRHISVSSSRATTSPRETAGAAPAWHAIPTAAARRFHQICVAKSAEIFAEFGLKIGRAHV